MHIDIKKKMFRNVGELYRNKGEMGQPRQYDI